ncbi:unnamed protein product [Pleuronectes platessa]|uniref:Uncharacterized protein n=1 Tax=Pleuronectes platessa TaxID=8262 RepID=A0A9N7UCD3_PLEPL|nr:unnamed protein product [Pleuronectes platessa]
MGQLSLSQWFRTCWHTQYFGTQVGEALEQEHSERMRNSAPEKAGRQASLLEETATTEHMTGAPSQLFLLWRSAPSLAHTQGPRAGYHPAVIGETGLAQPRRRSEEDGRVGGEMEEEEEEGAARPCVTNRHKICSGCTVKSSSDWSGLTAPAEVGSV